MNSFLVFIISIIYGLLFLYYYCCCFCKNALNSKKILSILALVARYFISVYFLRVLNKDLSFTEYLLTALKMENWWSTPVE
jgi:hypothetical protein